MNLDNISQITKGFGLAIAVNNLQTIAAKGIKSNQYLLTGAVHSVQLSFSANLASKALNSLAQQVQLDWTGKAVSFISPLIIAYLASKRLSNHKVQLVIDFAHAHLGKLTSVISFVALGILFWQGQGIYVSVCMTWLAVKHLDNAQMLPACLSKAVNATEYFCFAFSLLNANWIEKVIFAVLVAHKLFQNFFPIQEETPDPQPIGPMLPPKLTPQELLNLDWNKCEINWDYLKHYTLPSVPDETDPSLLLEIFDKLSVEHGSIIETHVKNDPRAKDIRLSPTAYVRQKLVELIKEVQTKDLVFNNVNDNHKLERLLKIITHALSNKRDNLVCVEILMSLVIQLDVFKNQKDLSPKDKYKTIAKCAYQLTMDMEDVPIEIRIAIKLALVRQELFDRLTKDLLKDDFFGSLSHNTFVNALAADLGLLDFGAAADCSSGNNVCIDFLLRKVLQNECNQALKKGYTKASIISTLMCLPLEKSWHSWWHQWVERQEADEPSKAAWLQQLKLHDNIPSSIEGFGILGSQPCYRRIEPNALGAMLVEMGVFLKPKTPDCAPNP